MDPQILREAMTVYGAVYNEDLRDELDFQNWVNSLAEEGYDLSEYTWEEMYESYLTEMGQPGARPTGQNSSVFTLPKTPSAGSAGGSGSGGRRGSGSSPGGIRPAPRPATPAARPAAAVRPATPAARPAAATPAARPVAATPAPRPATPAARPAAATPAPRPATPAASKPAAFSPKPQSDVGAMIARSQARQAAQTPKPAAPTPAAKPTPRQARLNMEMEYDTFDTILEHLVAEGYAETNEAALAIMANMSEEWRQSIVEGVGGYDDPVAGPHTPIGKAVRSGLKTAGNVATKVVNRTVPPNIRSAVANKAQEITSGRY